ncbi:putative MFS multidrug transporter [Melanomma pulvis-pyrius CBS 109.77]|uniref:Putative MFS multidrug transporter n=1 Tax=Melanomma pulvis-pyrius CBS 109.77 TaxID=1314802 RepID=A0A6A6X7F6_9PLEO|nr:putative MFS multidrug transporter [Melanomma pulvis-pyrius CBS 109.77]
MSTIAPEQSTNPTTNTTEPVVNGDTTQIDEEGINRLPRIEYADLDAPYSAYGLWARRWIVLAASTASFFAPLSASIYYPALPHIASDIGVSNSNNNLTVTTYLIVQGLAPMVTGAFSDSAGRRPAYALYFFIYLFANLGQISGSQFKTSRGSVKHPDLELMCQPDYVALMVLRCLQSAGSSGVIAIANGVVSDIVTPQERGSFVAFASLSTNIGPAISPVIRGLLSRYLGWRWIFWFLVIYTACFCVPFFLFFPETCRTVMHDVSVFPPLLNRCVTDYIRRRTKQSSSVAMQPASRKQKLCAPNPLITLKVFTVKETAMIIMPCGILYSSLYAVLTGASDAFKTKYGFDKVKVPVLRADSIPPAPRGMYMRDTALDWNFRRHTKRLGIPLTANRQQELSKFPIETARIQVALPAFLFLTISLAVYGWVIQEHYSIVGTIVLLVAMSWTNTALFQSLNVLLVDTYPGRGAIVTAAVNLVRCDLGAATTAVISPMTNGIGNGWAYTFIAAIGLTTAPMLLLNMKYGMHWRAETTDKERRKARKRAEH